MRTYLIQVTLAMEHKDFEKHFYEYGDWLRPNGLSSQHSSGLTRRSQKSRKREKVKALRRGDIELADGFHINRSQIQASTEHPMIKMCVTPLLDLLCFYVSFSESDEK